MADDDVTAAPEETGVAPDLTESGGETKTSDSWPAEAQAEYTRKTQALAEDRKAWDTERTKQTQQLQQYAQQMQQQQYARQAQQQAQQQYTQGQQSQTTMLDELRKLPYLDGATAAQLMERMVTEGINPLNQAVQQRDQIIAKLRQDQQELSERVGSSQGKQAEQALEARFVKLREEQGLPDHPLIYEMMRDMYLSRTGAPLDQEFPELLRKQWEGIKKVVRDADRATAKAAKASPFPSRGGEISPTSGKTGGYKTPEERTDELWPMLNPGQSE